MATRQDLLIQARNCGNWVERKNRHELDIALMSLLHDYPGSKVIASDCVALENMRDAREAALSALCPIAESVLPSAVTEEWDRAAMQASEAGPTQAMKPETSWRTQNCRYERRVSASGVVEWLAPQYNARPPSFGEFRSIDDQQYDYQGHATAPNAVSLRVVRDVAVRLGNATLAAQIDAVEPPQTVVKKMPERLAQRNAKIIEERQKLDSRGVRNWVKPLKKAVPEASDLSRQTLTNIVNGRS